MPISDVDRALERWLAALDQRYLADLEPSEVARALRALSSCYVERRAKLSSGGALDGAGKRAAFALFYAPVHFLAVRHIVRTLGEPALQVTHIDDIGCGTGAAGAAWALEASRLRLPPEGKAGTIRVTGVDRHPWAVAEANWTYRQLGLRGRAIRSDAARVSLRVGRGSGVVAAYTVNELPEDTRARLLGRLIAAAERGAHVLIVEPIARRIATWWDTWAAAFRDAGGRMDEWRVPAELPPRQRDLARAAGLAPRELTARSLFLPAAKRFG